MEQMRCAQCGRELSAATVRAGACPSCGHPIAQAAGGAPALTEDDSQTRPMPPSLRPAPDMPLAPDAAATAPPPPPAEALTAPAAPAPSYRPPSLPRASAESVAPARASGASERTAVMPLGLLPGAVATPPALPDGESTEPQRPGLGWLAALALLIVLLLGSAAVLLAANGQLGGILGEANPTATASPTAGPPPPPAGFARYTGTGYSVDYPSGWIQTTLPGSTVLFGSPGVEASFQLQTFDHASEPQALDDGLISQFGQLFLRGNAGSSAVSGKIGPTTITVAGTVWTREEADVTVTAGGKTVTWHVVVLAVSHAQQSFLVSFYAPSASFAGQDTAFFEPMVNSLLLVPSHP